MGAAALGSVACAGASRSDLFDDVALPSTSRADADARPTVLDGPDGSDAAAMPTVDATASTDATTASVSDAGASTPTTSDAPRVDAAPGTTPPVVHADACTGTYAASCDPTCAPMACADYTCAAVTTGAQPLGGRLFPAPPWRLRTPSVQGRDLTCDARCGGASVATSVMRIPLEYAFEEDFTVSVGAPWKVAIDSRYAFCVSAEDARTFARSCVQKRTKKAVITVYTTEPNAPSRDVVVDVSARLACGVAR